ncbi:MAG: DUF2007 domain-containing protein [Verrucomicrobiales bacterium]|jgi:hypothetical protein|nr:DUF2007 domain-containing protein [Verrucomicrobiales bacterium]
MQTVFTCSVLNQALLLQSWLTANGLDSFIPEELTGNILPYIAVNSGIQIQVAEADVDRAAGLIKEYFAAQQQP